MLLSCLNHPRFSLDIPGFLLASLGRLVPVRTKALEMYDHMVLTQEALASRLCSFQQLVLIAKRFWSSIGKRMGFQTMLKWWRRLKKPRFPTRQRFPEKVKTRWKNHRWKPKERHRWKPKERKRQSRWRSSCYEKCFVLPTQILHCQPKNVFGIPCGSCNPHFLINTCHVPWGHHGKAEENGELFRLEETGPLPRYMVPLTNTVPS